MESVLNPSLLTNSDLFDTGDGEESDDEINRSPLNELLSDEDDKGNTKLIENDNKQRKKKARVADKSHVVKKKDIQRIHSETQRMIRESKVSLPQYQPKTKTLDGFLIKLKKGKSSFEKPKKVTLKSYSNETLFGTVTTPTCEDEVSLLDKEKECSLHNADCDKENVHDDQCVNEKQIGNDTPPINKLSEVLQLTEDKDPPKLSSIDGWNDNSLETPIRELQMRFIKHSTCKPKIHKVEEKTESIALGILSQDEISQHSDTPGAVRRRLKHTLQLKLSERKAEERKRMEEIRKIDNEEIEPGELSEMEAELSENDDDYETDDSDKEWYRTKSKEENENKDNNKIEEEVVSCEDCDDDDGDDDDVFFVPSRRGRVIESDDEDIEETTNDSKSNKNIEVVSGISTVSHDHEVKSHDLTVDKISLQQVNYDVSHDQEVASHDMLEEASMGPLIYSETLDQTTIDSNPFIPDNSRLTTTTEDSQLTEVINDEDEFEMSYQLGQSLPPHQMPRINRQESDELFTTPSITRQSSIMSDKDVFRGLETHPIRTDIHIKETSQPIIDEDTQFLDANGFLCIRNRPKKFNSPHSALQSVVEKHPDSSPSELIALCSGAFETQISTDNNESTVKKLSAFSSLACLNTQDSISDVLGLCSGVFPTDTNSHENDDDDMMPKITRKKFNFRSKPKQTNIDRLQDFVESEAELSGSDVGEEEEDEPRGDEDEYEEDSDASDVPLSDNELWDQVNKAHMKQLIADDNANIRDIQERFLLEGDLYEDGLHLKNGFFRTRRFGHGSEGSLDLFGDDRTLELHMEEGDVLVGSQAEAKRRKERLEKNEFIKINQKSQGECGSLLGCDEDSQSILELIKETSCPPILKIPKTSHDSHLLMTSSAKKSQCGSFLKHKTNTLHRLSSYTSESTTGGRGFVFQTDSTPSTQNKRKNTQSVGLLNKRPRLDKSISLPSTKSIFDKLK